MARRVLDVRPRRGGLGEAQPPRRIVDLIGEVHAETGSGGVESICQADWAPAASEIARRIQAVTDR